MRLPGTARVGIFALCLGVVEFGVAYYWVHTRTLIPVDIPVALAPGHLQTGDFKVNVEAYFSVQIRLSPGGEPGCGEGSGLLSRRLTKIGNESIMGLPGEGPLSGGVTQGTYLGTFHGKPGNYNLDIEIFSATQYLNRCQPRLQIEASYSDFDNRENIRTNSVLVFLFCEWMGIMLIILPALHFRRTSLRIHTLRIFDESTRAAPVPPPADQSQKRSIPWLLILGTLSASIGIATCAGTLHWYDTRGFVLVDKPVSLGKGHIKTGGFTSNLKGTFDIEFQTEVPSVNGCPQYLALKTRWVVTRDGTVTAHRERGESYYEKSDEAIDGMYLYSFDAKPGTYNLDVDVVSDGSCLDVGKPRLRVYLSSWDRAEYDDLSGGLQLFSFLCVGTGFAFLLAQRFAMLNGGPRPLPLMSSLSKEKPTWGITGLCYRRFPHRRSWAMNPVTNLPTIALMCALTGFLWLVPMWVMYASGQRSSQGLFVSLPRKGLSTITSALGLPAPIVRIDAKRHVYLNYKQTTWEELPNGLEQALLGLPVRVVYFEGDDDIMFMDAARAIDVVQEARAKAILWTPRAKDENR